MSQNPKHLGGHDPQENDNPNETNPGDDRRQQGGRGNDGNQGNFTGNQDDRSGKTGGNLGGAGAPLGSEGRKQGRG